MTAPRATSWLCVDIVVHDARGLPEDEAAGACAASLGHLGCLGLEVRGGPPLRVAAFFPPETRAADVSSALLACAVEARVVASGGIPDGQWVERYNRTLVPIHVGRRLTILPGPGDAGPGRVGLHVTPGRAFGTGHHESTRLALEALEAEVREGDSVLDVGTGSGILALAAARLGARPVIGVDDDPEAVEVAEENRTLLEEREHVAFEVASDPAAIPGQFDVVVANITADVILALLPSLAMRLAPAGRLLLSGILGSEEAQVGDALTSLGFGASWSRAGEWSAARASRLAP